MAKEKKWYNTHFYGTCVAQCEKAIRACFLPFLEQSPNWSLVSKNPLSSPSFTTAPNFAPSKSKLFWSHNASVASSRTRSEAYISLDGITGSLNFSPTYLSYLVIQLENTFPHPVALFLPSRNICRFNRPCLACTGLNALVSFPLSVSVDILSPQTPAHKGAASQSLASFLSEVNGTPNTDVIFSIYTHLSSLVNCKLPQVRKMTFIFISSIAKQMIKNIFDIKQSIDEFYILL